MGAYDRTLGALLLASWANSSLITIEGLQIYEYFTRFRHDSRFNKACVLAALGSDIGGMIAVLSAVYLYTIKNFGDATYAASQPWSMPLYVITSGLSGAITQTFLGLRIYRLTGWILYPITFGLLSAGSLAGALGTAIQVAVATSYSDRSKLTAMVTLWLSCAAAVDILIAVALVWTLFRTKTSFKETGSLLRRLMVSSVKTGSVTAGAALIALILYSWSPNDNLCVFFSLSLGRLYTISMLTNLNARNGESSSGRGYSSGEGKTHTRSGNVLNDNTTELRGVKVTSDTVTRVDRLEEEERTYGARMAINDVDGKKDFEDRDARSSENPSSSSVEVPYQGSNHRDEWDDRSLEHSQVDLVEENNGSRRF